MISKIIFQFGFLITVSGWTVAVLIVTIVCACRLYFFWRRVQKKL